jgi:hypothetical protein
LLYSSTQAAILIGSAGSNFVILAQGTALYQHFHSNSLISALVAKTINTLYILAFRISSRNISFIINKNFHYLVGVCLDCYIRTKPLRGLYHYKQINGTRILSTIKNQRASLVTLLFMLKWPLLVLIDANQYSDSF